MELALGSIVHRVKFCSVESSEDFNTGSTKSSVVLFQLWVCLPTKSLLGSLLSFYHRVHTPALRMEGRFELCLQPQNGHFFHSLKDRV